MATGPEHYQEAERLLRLASDFDVAVMGHAQRNGITSAELTAGAATSGNLVGAAQVHATLALAAATALLDGGWAEALRPAVSDVD